MTAEAAGSEETVAQYRGVIIIEWPAPGGGPYSAMAGARVCITDAVSGKPIETCQHADIVVRADVNELVTANLILFTDAVGEPLFDGEPVADGEEILTGVFPFLVAEMRVAKS